MNIALPTLLLVAALIPSIAFLNAFYAGKLPRQLTTLSPLGELALYFAWAIPANAAAFWFANVQISKTTIDLLVHALGLSNKPLLIDPVLQIFSAARWALCVRDYLLFIVLAFAAGWLARSLVWALRLDVHVPVLRLKAEWYYVLLGRLPGVPRNILPQADILVSHPEGSRLYVGVVDGLEPNKDGGIEAIYLIAAQRYRKKKKDGTRDLVPIPGDALAIYGPTIHSINMRYYVVPGPDGWWSRLWWHVGTFLRAMKEA